MRDYGLFSLRNPQGRVLDAPCSVVSALYQLPKEYVPALVFPDIQIFGKTQQVPENIALYIAIAEQGYDRS